MKQILDYLKNVDPAAVWKTVGIGAILLCAVIFYLTQEGQTEAEISFDLDSAEAEEEEEEASRKIPEEMKVDVKGEVAFPGVYPAQPEQRVEELITEAGGPTEDAVMESVNLAQRVHDEMIIYVPSSNEEADMESPIVSGQSDTGISVNRAEQAEWETLPGIGPAKASAIVQYREDNGPFSSVEELTNVPGIGEKTLESMRDQLSLH